MARGETKTKLLDVGREVFSERGYNHAGIEAVLQAAGVPRGSFYNYFSSKEDFGLQVIDRLGACYEEELGRYLDDPTIRPLERLRGYFQATIDRLELNQCRKGCLVGTLGQEMADQNEAFRMRLEEIFDRWATRYAECIVLAQTERQIRGDLDPRDFAEFCLNSWQGAVLRAKTSRSTAPLRAFLIMVFDGLAAG